MNCLTCGDSGLALDDGHFVCLHCGLVKVNTPINYNFDNYTSTYKSLFDTDLEKRINVGRVGLLMKYLPTDASVMDYGCSCGNFLSRLETYGYHCVGYEPSPSSVQKQTCQAHIITEKDATMPGNLDMITLFDVIEHFPEPLVTTEFLSCLLKNGGYFYVTTPDPTTLGIRGGISRPLKSFYHLKPGEHAYLWTPEALDRLFTSLGMKRVYLGHEEGLLRKNSGGDQDIVTVIYRKEK